MHVIALDTKTGKKLWDVVTDDYKTERTYDSGPLVVKDKVLMGGRQLRAGERQSTYGESGRLFSAGRMLHHRPRSRDGKRAVAVQPNRAQKRAGGRHLE